MHADSPKPATPRRARSFVPLLGLGLFGGLIGVAIWLFDSSAAPPPPPPPPAASEPELAAALSAPSAAARPLGAERAAAAVPLIEPPMAAPESADRLQPLADKSNGFRRGGLRLSSAQLHELANHPNLQPRMISRQDLQSAHPLVSDRPQLQRRLELVGELDAALDRAEPAKLRELVARYRALDPLDASRTGEGYERLADCLEHPGSESRAAAQSYYDSQRAPRLRSAIQRTCLAP